jgi:hypothetical protein
MRAIVSVLFLVVVFPASAWAQPGQAPAEPPVQQPYAQPYAPQPYAPQPYAPQPYQPYQPYPIQLTPEEHKLLSRGEITDGQVVGGVVANWLLGFGIGQAVQGRWSESGWIFTLGEAGGITMMIVGALRIEPFCEDEFNSCERRNDQAVLLLLGGLAGYVGFHIWSIVDAATGPSKHNRKVRDLRQHLGMPRVGSTQIVPYAGPSRDGGGTVGLTIRF